MKQILYCTLFLCLTCINQLIAGNITGKVSNEKGKPLKGIPISVKNTSNSVKTLEDGSFILEDVSEKDTLMIYPSKNKFVLIPVKNNTSFDIRINKRDLSVASGDYREILTFLNIAKARTNPNVLTKGQIEKLSANSVSELLRGDIPGLQITMIDNAPVAIIRGASSLTGDVEPLYLVDSVQYTKLADVDSSVDVKDIESLEVLKDGSMFGVKGANGVIIIKTKIY
ncbi:TonB-dependent receptor plug domain-containing protein [Dysgonomonas reticulitermitis]